MGVFNGFFPIVAGKEQAMQLFVTELLGPRKRDWEDQRDRFGNTRETWAIQQTPMGSFVLVWFESPDIGKSFGELAADDTDFGTWYKGQILDLIGMDLGAPPQGPPPEIVVDWSR